MKLLFCWQCQDVIKLELISRSCKCGLSDGWYHEDGWHATVRGKHAEVIGVDNLSFRAAYGRDTKDVLNLAAWMFSHTGADAARIFRAPGPDSK